MANILVIDDDADIRPILKVALTRSGHAVTMCARGEEGLAAALVGQFDLVILDLMMPDVDGFEVAQRLRANPRTQNILILVLTARSQLADQERAFASGADAYVAKPFDPEELVGKIAELLKKGRAPADESLAVNMAKAPSGRVIVALGLRGGVGTTTIAVNLAGLLVQAGRRVCLIDLSPAGGHVGLQLRLRPKSTWADLPMVPNTTTIGQALTRHESGLMVLPAPAEPVRRSLPGETFQAALEALKSGFNDIVVDSAPVLDYPSTVALQAAQRILIPLTAEITAVHTAVGAIHTLVKLGISENLTRVLLNQVTPEAALPQAAVEKALGGRSPQAFLPYERAQIAALAQGNPLVFGQPNSPLVTALRNFAAKL